MKQELTFHSPFSQSALSLHEFFGRKLYTLRSEIIKDASRFLTSGRNETEYVQSLIQKYTLQAPLLDLECINKTPSYEKVQRPPLNRSVQQLVVTFSIPYTGEISLIQYIPRSGTSLSCPVLFLRNHSVCFEIRSPNKDAEQIRQEKEQTLAFLNQRIEAILSELEQYNRAVAETATSLVEQQKKQRTDDEDLLSKL